MNAPLWAILAGIPLCFAVARKAFGLALTDEEERRLTAISRRPFLSREGFLSRMQRGAHDAKTIERVRQTLAQAALSCVTDRVDGRLLYPEDSLADDLAIGAVDYLDYAAILADLQDQLGIVIPDQQADRVRTVEDLVHLCEQL